MKYLLGIVSVIFCLIYASFDVFRPEVHLNVAYWGVIISLVYLALSVRSQQSSE